MKDVIQYSTGQDSFIDISIINSPQLYEWYYLDEEKSKPQEFPFWIGGGIDIPTFEFEGRNFNTPNTKYILEYRIQLFQGIREFNVFDYEISVHHTYSEIVEYEEDDEIAELDE